MCPLVYVSSARISSCSHGLEELQRVRLALSTSQVYSVALCSKRLLDPCVSQVRLLFSTFLLVTAAVLRATIQRGSLFLWFPITLFSLLLKLSPASSKPPSLLCTAQDQAQCFGRIETVNLRPGVRSHLKLKHGTMMSLERASVGGLSLLHKIWAPGLTPG